MRGAIENEFTQIESAAFPFVFQTVHGFFDLQPIAGGAAQRRVHVSQHRARVHAAFIAERDHGLGEFACIGLGLHERGTAEFHIEDEGIQALGKFLERIEAVMNGMLGTVSLASRSA